MSSVNYRNRNQPPSNRQLLILLGIFAAFTIGVIWLIGWIASSIVWLIPYSVEQQLGAVIVPVYERLAMPSPAQNTLNDLLDRLEAQLPSQRQNRDYKVLYIPKDTVNALAVPGDRIIIYSGLVKQAQSENELMMVLGHELGHFANRDHLRSLGRAVVVQIAIASIIGDIGSIGSIAVSGIETISNAQYSQSQESQADEVGLTLLQKTYGHVAGATDFFARMSQKQQLDIDFLATHPAPSRRVKEIQQLIKQRNYKVEQKQPLPSTLS
ncbi:MAG: M48 family metallopeptidase [Chroococcus sp. CMT-3BRIN-NPC107]|jgi:predicted Zn-dependent protease|nr:M48 family metallopeptidase [Chroococcus sp. CMT-3BRIN-NPC107]